MIGQHYKLRAFSLIEILITIAIISILVSIAAPSYARYTRRAHYTEITSASSPLKLAVDACYQADGDLKQCSSGENGIPAAQSKASGLVAKEAVSAGVIDITPTEKYGITAADTYELKPVVNGAQLVWSTSGGGVKKGYA